MPSGKGLLRAGRRMAATVRIMPPSRPDGVGQPRRQMPRPQMDVGQGCVCGEVWPSMIDGLPEMWSGPSMIGCSPADGGRP
ncbi:MAG: hypothetical protein CMO29_17320 [Tistrella sp.]|nr:hypothetical protein [Tistrella sp.]